MKRLSVERRGAVAGVLIEGMSMRAVIGATGVAKNTFAKLLVDLGQASAEYQDGALTNLPCQRIECDEVWSFCYARRKNAPDEHKDTFGYGDVWTWTATDADTKLVSSWLVGERTVHDPYVFLGDLKSRLRYRVHLTSDGRKPYLTVVEPLFSSDEIDFTMLHMIYGRPEGVEDKRRYSPAVCTGIDKRSSPASPTGT